MLLRSGRILEKAERDPAGHEVVFGAIIAIGRNGGVTHHAVRGLRIVAINESSGQQANLAPPFIGVLMLQIPKRGFRNHLGRRCEFIARQQPVKAAERITQVRACFLGNCFEQRSTFSGVCRSGIASLDDRDLSGTKPLGSAHRRAKVLGADPPVHAHGVVSGGQLVGKSVDHAGFQLGRHFRRAPYHANFARGALMIALS